MTEIHDPAASRRDHVRLLLEELARVTGTLSEIMTAWRRAAPSRPGLPLSDLTRPQDTTRRLAADIEAASGPAQRPDAASFAERFSAIQEDIADARAKTSELDRSEVVDQGLWDLLSAAMNRAETRLAHLTPDLAADS